ncbi:MAG: hypothetical protein UIC63_06580 [Bacteroidaceae bacterium]|nr:hypothetical protein [Bacteroidaceae bacterium]
MDAERNRRNLRRVRGIVKYGAALLTLMGAIHCALILFDVEHIYCHLLWCVFALTLGVYLNRLFCLCRLHLVCVWYISALLVLMTVEHRIDWTQNKVFVGAVAVIGSILFVMMLWRARTNC